MRHRDDSNGAQNPNEVFLVDGHADAIGNDDDNLPLSDRSAPIAV
jgi:outer membrane protein OmpA-like peptidoglycan-associated protein